MVVVPVSASLTLLTWQTPTSQLSPLLTASVVRVGTLLWRFVHRGPRSPMLSCRLNGDNRWSYIVYRY